MATALVPLTLVVLVAAPFAAAAPLVSVAIGPDGMTDADHPFYLVANVTKPEGPRAATQKDDCSAAERPASLEESVGRLRPREIPSDPRTVNSLAPYLPTCVGASTLVARTCGSSLGCREPAYASYNASSGRYYVEGPGAPVGMRTAGTSATTGTTGATLAADCEYCPPPYALLA